MWLVDAEHDAQYGRPVNRYGHLLSFCVRGGTRRHARYYGWYSNKSRGVRAKAAAAYSSRSAEMSSRRAKARAASALSFRGERQEVREKGRSQTWAC